MLEVLPGIMPFLIPITALLVGGAVIGSIFVVDPIVKALTKLAESNQARLAGQAERDLRQLEERLDRIEGALQRLIEEQRFDRELLAARSDASTNPAETEAVPRQAG